ncbi:uncharacterized protein METZ01_LOCUS297832 [marine metagenome]|uniref:Uncharacterized protein n=1 Tax=marine metagenome TaxID=408172 RepID=A0A382M8P7_9ZZZZ
MAYARSELEEFEERRIELQEQFNPMEMLLIPPGKLRMGANTPRPR